MAGSQGRFYSAAAHAVIFLALQVAGDDAQISTRAEKQGRKQRWTHHDVGDGEAPSTRFPCDTADMKTKAHETIDQRKKTGVTKKGFGQPPAKKPAQTGSSESAREDDRRIHYRIRVAALVVLIGHLHARHQQCHRALEGSMLEVIDHELCRTADRRR